LHITLKLLKAEAPGLRVASRSLGCNGGHELQLEPMCFSVVMDLADIDDVMPNAEPCNVVDSAQRLDGLGLATVENPGGC